MTKVRMTMLIRTLAGVAMLLALLALPVVTGHQGIAHAQGTCAGLTDDRDSNFDANIPSTSNGSGNFDCIVGLNDVSNAVKQLQISMNDCYPRVIEQQLAEDGHYGPLTKEAMQDVQAALGIPPSGQDGVYGPMTKAAGFKFEGAFIQPPHPGCAPDLT
jgi:peptidoglycan hydrolase-like protein with peptidoglycan-binding domain